MRRLLAMGFAAALALTTMAPVASAQGPEITGVSIQSATVDRSGLLYIKGSFYCQHLDQGIWVNANGNVTQSIGKKVLIQSGFNDLMFECANGPTTWEVWLRAYNGTFAPGWASVDVGFGVWGCWDPNDPNNCWVQGAGGGNFYVKIVKK